MRAPWVRIVRRAAVAAAAVLAVGATTSCRPVEEGSFTMLTYNVAGLPQEISKEHPGVNIPLISPKLEPYDIVVTQEDFDWWVPALDGIDFANYHTRLRASNTFPWRTGVHPGPGAVGIDGTDPERPMPLVGDGLGIMSRFAFGAVDRVPWRHCFGGADTADGGAGDCLAMKGFARTTVTLAPGILLDLYTVHGEAGRTPTDTRMLSEDFEYLAGYINTHSVGRPVIVAGDTNLHTTPGHVMEPQHGPIWSSFVAATRLIDVCRITPCRDPGAIDKVAWRNGGGVLLAVKSQREMTDVFVDGAGAALSDHPPVAVEFDWSRWGA